LKAGDEVEKIPVALGLSEQVPLTVEKDMAVTVPISRRNEMKVSVTYDAPLTAPVKKGQQVGTLHVEFPAGVIEQPLIAAADVEKLGFFKLAFAKAKLMLSKKHASGT